MKHWNAKKKKSVILVLDSKSQDEENEKSGVKPWISYSQWRYKAESALHSWSSGMNMDNVRYETHGFSKIRWENADEIFSPWSHRRKSWQTSFSVSLLLAEQPYDRVCPGSEIQHPPSHCRDPQDSLHYLLNIIFAVVINIFYHYDCFYCDDAVL